MSVVTHREFRNWLESLPIFDSWRESFMNARSRLRPPHSYRPATVKVYPAIRNVDIEVAMTHKLQNLFMKEAMTCYSWVRKFPEILRNTTPHLEILSCHGHHGFICRLVRRGLFRGYQNRFVDLAEIEFRVPKVNPKVFIEQDGWLQEFEGGLPTTAIRFVDLLTKFHTCNIEAIGVTQIKSIFHQGRIWHLREPRKEVHHQANLVADKA